MPLIHCWECGKQISDLAKACPHCGAPKQKDASEFSATEINESKNIQKPSLSEAKNDCETPATQNKKKPSCLLAILIVCGLFVAAYFLNKMLYQKDIPIHERSVANFDKALTDMLVAGEWDKVIITLKSVPKGKNNYKYSQTKLNRLIKGHELFKNARDRWKCEVNGEVLNDCLDLSGNVFAYSSKFSGNTWFVKYRHSNKWEIDKRFVDYLDNGHLLIAGFHDGKFKDMFEIWQ